MADPGTEDDREEEAGRVLARLRHEQTFLKGTVAATICGILGVALAHSVALSDIHARTSIATAFIGVLVAFGMRQWGRGVDRRFRLTALILTAILMFTSVVLSGCVQRAATSRFTLEQLVDLGEEGLMGPRFALVLFREAIDFQSVFLWALGFAAAWSMSGRRLRPGDLRD